MEIIDYRTLADEKADEFLAENYPHQDNVSQLLRTAYKVGFVDGHGVALEQYISHVHKMQEIVK